MPVTGLALTATLVIVTGLLPVLVNVTVWGSGVAVKLLVLTGWLPKNRLGCDNITEDVSPVPMSKTVWGLLGALSVIVIIGVIVPLGVGPSAIGVKVAVMLHDIPGVSELPAGQEFFRPKLPLTSVSVMSVIVKSLSPALVKVMACRDVVRTGWLPNISVGGRLFDPAPPI
jgi:hypothetical protein